MSVWSSKIKPALGAFRRDRKGGIAVIFAFAATPVIFLSLVMIDFSRASTARANMQQTLDASTLLAARSTAIAANDIQIVGDNAYQAQIATDLGATHLKDTFAPSGNSVVGDANGTVQPIASGLFLGGPIKIAAHSVVVRSMNKLEIAMVLDTTGSMAGSKISNLQTAADDFIDTMSSASARSVQIGIADPVKISIVPFSNTVKIQAPVSLTNYDTTHFTGSGLPIWLDGRAQSTPYNYDIFTTASAKQSDRIDRFAKLKLMKAPWGGCVENRAEPYDVTDDPPTATAATTSPTTAQIQSMFTPYFWPDEADVKSGGQSSYTNVKFNNSENDYLADGFSLTSAKSVLTSWLVPQGNPAKYTVAPKSGTNPAGFTYGPNAGCSMQQMLPLGTGFAAMKVTVAGLVAGGETNIPIGLAWGWHSISPNLPLGGGSNGPAAYGTANLTKIVVLMTDGQNTEDPVSDDNASLYHGYGYVWQNHLGLGGDSTKLSASTVMANAKATGSSTRTSAIDARMSLLCTNMKAKGIVIYTVGVGVTTASQKLLTACATTPGQYYSVNASGTNMDAAFSAIAGSIQNLRISQ